MAKRRRKQRAASAGAADAFLGALDRLFDGIARAGVAAVRGVFRLVRLCVWLLLRAARVILHLLLWAPRRAAEAVRARRDPAARCLAMSGGEFEAYVAEVLRHNGFRHVELTRQSGDQGVDILALRDGESWAVQCKNYSGAVGNFAVQEVAAGRTYYGCDRAAVVCPGSFTRAAGELAESTDVELWDGRALARMIRRYGRMP